MPFAQDAQRQPDADVTPRPQKRRRTRQDCSYRANACLLTCKRVHQHATYQLSVGRYETKRGRIVPSRPIPEIAVMICLWTSDRGGSHGARRLAATHAAEPAD